MANEQPRGRRGGVTVGVVLVVLGLVFFIGQFVDLEGPLFLVGLGLVFLAVYSLGRRLLGFVIAGWVLLAIGVFAGLDEANVLPGTVEGPVFLVLLGAAFLLVYLAHTRALASWGARNWPLIAGLVLWAIGALILLIENAVLLPPEARNVILRWWPLVLIAAGLWLLARRLQESRR
jgi:hypothetical protein